MPYQGRQPGVGVRNRFIFIATSGQTSFSGADSNGLTLKYPDATYTDVFLNGVLLIPVTDYAATNNTSVVLSSGAGTSDVVEIVAYDISSIANTVPVSGGTFTGPVTVGGTLDVTGTTTVDVLTATGLVSASRSGVVADLNRTGSDGSIIDLRKDGTTVGSIGNAGTDVYFRKVSGAGVYCSGTAVLPFGAHSLGQASDRWSDLYLSGGVYLGGTAAANLLDYYEEGTWTSTVGGVSATTNTVVGQYTKIGNVVTINGSCTIAGKTGSAGTAAFNLPFAPSNKDTTRFGMKITYNNVDTSVYYISPYNGGSTAFFYNNVAGALSAAGFGNGTIKFNGTYHTT